jgi:putative hydrolase of the HAD superfamily
MKAASAGTIFWDFDGTLVSRPRMWSSACMEALDELLPGHTVSIDELRSGLSAGFPWNDPQRSYVHLSEPNEWWAHVAGHFQVVLRSLGVREGLDTITQRVRQKIVDASRYQVYDDVVPTLEALAAEGWQHLIVSNHIPELDQVVARLGLKGFFTEVVSSARIGYEKPHPEIFRHALRAAIPGRPVWMIGDNPKADCLPAVDLGIQAVLVRTLPGPFAPYAPDLSAAAHLIRSHGAKQNTSANPSPRASTQSN